MRKKEIVDEQPVVEKKTLNFFLIMLVSVLEAVVVFGVMGLTKDDRGQAMASQ